MKVNRIVFPSFASRMGTFPVDDRPFTTGDILRFTADKEFLTVVDEPAFVGVEWSDGSKTLHVSTILMGDNGGFYNFTELNSSIFIRIF